MIRVKRTVTDEVTITVKEFRRQLGLKRWGITRLVLPQPQGALDTTMAMPERYNDKHKAYVLKFQHTSVTYLARKLR